MAIIKPFQAVFFNKDKVELSKVVCPPYDVISPVRQQHYHAIDEHNFIHILLRKDEPGQNKYKRAAEIFRRWLDEDALIQDGKEAIYFYSHQYKIRGETKTRLGFISLLHLGDNKSAPFKHEHTHQEAKDDRFKLLEEVRANLSPIFVVFKDKARIIRTIYDKYIQRDKPFLEVVDDEKNTHKLWRVDEPKALQQIQAKMAEESIFIADGHHRYEVACAWRERMRAEKKNVTGSENFNYILTYFTNTDPHGLTILPIHRLVKFASQSNITAGLANAEKYFDTEELENATRLFFLMEKSVGREHLLGVSCDKKYWLLRLKNVKILDTLAAGKSASYRSLDVSILNYLVFEKIFGVACVNNPDLSYSAQAQELVKQADADSRLAAFFLNPVKIEQIIAVALGGERMPPKSTYFYPKVLSGLLINKLE